MQSCANYMAQQAAKRGRDVNLWIRAHGIEECVELIATLRYKLRMFGVLIDGPTDMSCNIEAVYKNAYTPESKLRKKHHSISYNMTRKAVANGACRISKEVTLTDLAELFTKVLPKHRREYNLNKFTY